MSDTEQIKTEELRNESFVWFGQKLLNTIPYKVNKGWLASNSNVSILIMILIGIVIVQNVEKTATIFLEDHGVFYLFMLLLLIPLFIIPILSLELAIGSISFKSHALSVGIFNIRYRGLAILGGVSAIFSGILFIVRASIGLYYIYLFVYQVITSSINKTTIKLPWETIIAPNYHIKNQVSTKFKSPFSHILEKNDLNSYEVSLSKLASPKIIDKSQPIIPTHKRFGNTLLKPQVSRESSTEKILSIPFSPGRISKVEIAKRSVGTILFIPFTKFMTVYGKRRNF